METFSNAELYEIFSARDARYDGRFFVGVKTTGIYCRPVCPAMPKAENCSFYESQAAAEKAGFRPCLVCRPELAPGLSPIDSKRNIAHSARILLEEKMNSEHVLEEVCTILGCSDRHLRRVFQEEFGVRPIEYLQTARLLLAKKLLTDTQLNMTEVAFSSGFSSLKRFNTLFKEKYRLSPSDFRKETKQTNKKDKGSLSIQIGYQAPYDFEGILQFFAARSIVGLEKIENQSYIRSLQIAKNQKVHKGLIKVSNNPKKSCLVLELSEDLLKVLPELIAKIKNQFDLYSDPHIIYESLHSIHSIDENLFKIGTRIPGSIDDFESCVRAIIGQLVSVKSARSTLQKIVEHFGEKITLEGEEMYLFPPAEVFAKQADITSVLGPLGVTKAKARAIQGVANYLIDNKVQFMDCLDPEKEIQNLMQIKGIGKWTAEYISLRSMKNTNILLDSDYAIKKLFTMIPALIDKDLQAKWNPWKSYITIGMWQYLEEIDSSCR